MRIVPNLNVLRMFEAAARHQSFARAASELCVTQSAVYRQIVALEERLDVRLFQRVRKRIFLTPQGSEYATRIRASLKRLERDTKELVARGHLTHSIELAVPLSFGAELLVPKLPQFRSLHPGIEVHLSVRNRPFLFFDTPFDAAIVFGTQTWEGTTGLTLLGEGPLVPVCNHRMSRSIETAAAVLDQPLLHLTSRPDDWNRWSVVHGLPENMQTFRGQRFDQFALLVSAAISGMGVALAPRILVERELAEKRLTIPVNAVMQTERRLLFIRPIDTVPSESLLAFQEWIRTVRFSAPLAAPSPSDRAGLLGQGQ